MRALIYDTLVGSTALAQEIPNLASRVLPRKSQGTIEGTRPFIVYGLGNATEENLTDETADEGWAERQFFQIWVHDETRSFVKIDRIVSEIKKLFNGLAPGVGEVLVIRYLETSQEFGNETYNTNFRYIRFQAVMVTK